jgi:GTP-binding protein EngB required for normal cell division
LASALEHGATCLPVADVDRARTLIQKAVARTSMAGGHTVVALAGSTGSGKSSLFNDLIGVDVARVAARRPTTSALTAAIWGSEPASALLDWLKVGQRYMVDDGASGIKNIDFGPMGAPAPVPGLELDGLVLLDLPDFDSLEAAHRVEADRVLDLADVFIWVTDPQKYADALLHEDYIAKLSAHDALTMVVLNQADRLNPEALAACRCDLLRLLNTDGVDDAEVIVTSAKDGSGVIDLRHRISQVVTSHNAAVRRVDSDLRAAATVLRSGVADSEPSLEHGADAKLVAALMRAAGVPVILDAVERDYRRETMARTGGPLTRWVRALRPAPLKLLRLSSAVSGVAGGISLSDVRAVLGRSSLPPATPAARSAVQLATRELGDRAGEGLPQPWADAVTDAATPAVADLADALDQAVIGTSLRSGTPLWWSVFGVAQWILATAAVAGLMWLFVLMLLGWLQLPTIDPPRLGALPYPFLLLAGSLLIGFLLTQLARAFSRVGGRRRKALVAGRLRQSVSRVARDRLVAPVQELLDRHRSTRENLEAARRS